MICLSFPTLVHIVRSESHSANCDDLDVDSDETCSAKGNSGNDKNQPNIIFVLADDLGYTDVQYNNASVITPTILRMAKEGIKLNQNYMQSWCTPSRYALMTGMYPNVLCETMLNSRPNHEPQVSWQQPRSNALVIVT